ncbi:MAG: TonB-dependent receptor [Candidatus Synoicihabitans palmerolidicus]|nr:TonB-dependent receptor [Candidatus Synoicihabitans palmerolidicus]
MRSDTYPDRDDLEFSPRAGLVWRLDDTWRTHASTYPAFRLPSLNELYRPFRIGNTITEANPDLAPESLLGFEIGATRSTAHSTLRVNAFTNDLDSAIANVTLGASPGVVPGVGFVLAGGLGRRRQNLERARIQGIELTGTWHVDSSLNLRADYLYTHAKDTTSGQTLPQVPAHTRVLGATWRPSSFWSFSAQTRYLSAAFDDDANTLVRNAVTTVDLRVSRHLGAGREIFLSVENAMDEEIVTRRTVGGLYDLGPPSLHPHRGPLGLVGISSAPHLTA